MRHTLGLDLPERRISLSAHDFAQMLGAPEVILTRAAKSGGAPDRRLALHAAARRRRRRRNGKPPVAHGERYLALARLLDASAEPPQPAKRPEPTPPVAARPTRLSVTEIEHWLRDPYTIYAKHILRLTPLDAVDTAPGAGDRGTVIHGAIGEFTQQFAEKLPRRSADGAARARRASISPRSKTIPRRKRSGGRALCASRAGSPTGRPSGAARRPRCMPRHAARSKSRSAHAALRLSARADRIERLADGRYAILDYKTGTAPTAPQVASGLAPQLTLEGAILRARKISRHSRRTRRSPHSSTSRSRAASRPARTSSIDLEGQHARRRGRPGADGAHQAWPSGSRTRRRLIARASGRCGSAAPMAPTIISRASRNGRCLARPTTTLERAE